MNTKYLGFREVSMTDDELSNFYSDLTTNRFGCLTNEYLIISNTGGEIIDYCRWDGQSFTRVIQKQINNDYSGKIKARNPQQILAVDLLFNTDISVKILSGCYGSGKDYFMTAIALELIKKNKYDKIMWVRNNIEVKNSKPLGYLPGSAYEKLLPFALPLADHVGGVDGLEYLIRQGKVEIEHLGYLRGRDIQGTIIICSESENMTKEHVQLLLGRVAEGSALWLNGDYRQTDSKVFEENNGLMIAVDKLKGHPKFGFVHLLKSERSETAAMADLLD